MRSAQDSARHFLLAGAASLRLRAIYFRAGFGRRARGVGGGGEKEGRGRAGHPGRTPSAALAVRGAHRAPSELRQNAGKRSACQKCAKRPPCAERAASPQCTAPTSIRLSGKGGREGGHAVARIGARPLPCSPGAGGQGMQVLWWGKRRRGPGATARRARPSACPCLHALLAAPAALSARRRALFRGRPGRPTYARRQVRREMPVQVPLRGRGQLPGVQGDARRRPRQAPLPALRASLAASGRAGRGRAGAPTSLQQAP